MALSTNSTVEYEANTIQQPFANLTDAGDHKTYTDTRKPWSSAPGFDAVGAGYGVVTGGAVTPAAALGNNNVDVAAMTLFAPGMTGADPVTGMVTIAAAADIAATRGTTNGYRITAVTVTGAGVVTAVAGTEGTAFSDAYGAAGGPPLIPVTSVLIAHLRLTSTTAAKITTSEIDQAVGIAQEQWMSPLPTLDRLTGKITFSDALPLSHTGPVTKRVAARVALPQFADLPLARDFEPADATGSQQVEKWYRAVTGGFDAGLSQASFEISLNDGITDAFIKKAADQPTLLFRFKQDKNRAPYVLTLGVPLVKRTFKGGSHPTAKITVAASQASVNVDA